MYSEPYKDYGALTEKGPMRGPMLDHGLLWSGGVALDDLWRYISLKLVGYGK